MIDPELSRLVEEDTPPLNPLLANGLATTHVKGAPYYVDQMFRAAARGFPKDLVYLRGVRCTPEEEFNELTKKKNKRMLDVARSDLYLMKYLFQYKGEMMPPRYMFLPFVGDAGSMVLSGSMFFVLPLANDSVISVTSKNLFVRLLRDKVTFERMVKSYQIEREEEVLLNSKPALLNNPGTVMEKRTLVSREAVQVAYSGIYHVDTKAKGNKRPEVNGKCTLMHYLLCKYGFAEVFARFAKCHPVVGTPEEINTNTYPTSEWVICSSSSVVDPRTRKIEGYRQSTIRIAIRIGEYTKNVKNMLGGFFYVVDLFPLQTSPAFVNDTRLWIKLMGPLLFPESLGEGIMVTKVESHISSLDQYLDDMIVQKLRDGGINVANIYELFAIIIECFDDWMTSNSDQVTTMYGKELTILPFLLEQIKQGIFNFYFRLIAASKKEEPLKMEQINKMMNSTLRPGLIHFIRSGHGEVQSISNPGDNKAFKVTSGLVPQENSGGVKAKNDRAMMLDPSKRLHASIAEVGNYSALTKAAPDGRSRVNLHLQIDEKGKILRNPAFVELLDGAQEKFNRR